MKKLSAALVASALAIGPVMAQQATPNQNLQNEADKGIKTHNSGASGNVGSQEAPGAAAHPPGQPGVGAAATAPSAQNSGTGISGAPGSKSGPPPDKALSAQRVIPPCSNRIRAASRGFRAIRAGHLRNVE